LLVQIRDELRARPLAAAAPAPAPAPKRASVAKQTGKRTKKKFPVSGGNSSFAARYVTRARSDEGGPASNAGDDDDDDRVSQEM
jgi:hypothetical protein